MFLVDTHTHLYLEDFMHDIDEVINRACKQGVTKLLLPNIDSTSIDAMHQLASTYPLVCYPMIGLHPTSVKENYRNEIAVIKEHLHKNNYIAIGEIGIDLYWDKSFIDEQIICFETQLMWAKTKQMPVVIHMRKSFDEVWQNIKNTTDLSGVFHCYSGTLQQAKLIIDKGFYLGIGGVVTYKNASLAEIVKALPLDYIVLETDAPFLTPAPYRGKRNESMYIKTIAEYIAEIKNIHPEEVAEITTRNANTLFNIV